MKDTDIEVNRENMHAPSYKLLVTTPMAAIMASGIDRGEWSGLLESIEPIYASAAADAHGEVGEALSTVAFMLQAGDALIRKYFQDDDLSIDRMMEISATGADVWMCKLSDGEIERAAAIRLFRAIQAGLIEAVGDLREQNQMIGQLIQIQDKIVDHISSLN